MFKIYMSPKSYKLNGPDPMNKEKSYWLRFKDHTGAEIDIKLTPEQFDEFTTLCADLRRDNDE